VDKNLAWTSSKRLESLTSCSSFNSLVTAKHLCPRFLDNQDPYFIAVFRRLAHSPLFFKWVVWEIVINYNNLRFTINVEFNSITSGFIDFFRYEDSLDAFPCFSKGADARKKVTISAAALLDVVGPNFVVNNEALISVNFLWSFPNKVLPLPMTFRSHHCCVKNRSLIRRKCFIYPIFLFCNNRCVINFFKSF